MHDAKKDNKESCFREATQRGNIPHKKKEILFNFLIFFVFDSVLTSDMTHYLPLCANSSNVRALASTSEWRSSQHVLADMAVATVAAK
jgi:hypothetical protein